MANSKDYITLYNGIKIQKGILEKTHKEKQRDKELANSLPNKKKSSEKDIKPPLEPKRNSAIGSISKNANNTVTDYQPKKKTSKNKRRNPKKEKVKNKKGIKNKKRGVETKKVTQPTSNKKTTAKTPVSKEKSIIPRYLVNSYVYDHTKSSYHRVVECSLSTITLHDQGKENYSLSLLQARGRIFTANRLLIGVLKKYSTIEDIRTEILDSPIKHSIKIIKANNRTVEEMDQLKKSFVPSIITDEEWDSWKKRIDDYSHPIKNPPLIRNLPTRRVESEKPDPIIYKNVNNKKMVINPQDFIIRVHNFKCINKGHHLEPITAVVFIRNITAGLIEYPVPAGYCVECKKYYIHSDIYEMYNLAYLPVTCDIYNESDYVNKPISDSNQWIYYSEKSILKKCGYTVGKNEDPGFHARQKILLSIIHHHIMTKAEILSFINWLIHHSKNNPNMHNAIKLWQSDYQKLEASDVNQKVIVRSIKKK